MGRRTSGQQVGFQGIGNVQANASTLTTTQANQDLTLDPNGIGGIIVNGDVTITNQQDLRLRESSGSGTNYIAMQAAATMAADYTITWPAAVSPTSGFVLSSDTSGNLSWSSAGGNIPVSDSGSTATVHYPLFGTNAGAIPTTLDPRARSNLTFVPSTGELFSDIGRHPNVIGSASTSGTLTIRGTSSATKATASVLMTDGVASSSTTTGTLVVTGGVGISGTLYSSTAVIEGTVNALRTENTKSAGHTLELADRDRVVNMNNSSPATVTVPNDSTVNFPVGSVVYINRTGAGSVTLAAAGGVTLSKTGTFNANEELICRKRSSNNWIVVDTPTKLTGTGGSLSQALGYTIHTYTSGSSSFII
jgi:hypothetical protein